MKRVLHVDAKMFDQMQQAAYDAELNGQDPAVAAMRVTGQLWELGDQIEVRVDAPYCPLSIGRSYWQ